MTDSVNVLLLVYIPGVIRLMCCTRSCPCGWAQGQEGLFRTKQRTPDQNKKKGLNAPDQERRFESTPRAAHDTQRTLAVHGTQRRS